MDFFISNAMAADAGSQGGGLQLVFMVAIFFGIMYFMIIRPQSKKGKEHAALLDSLSKGDEVVTSAGIIGKITKMGDNFIEVKTSESSSLTFQRHAVVSILPKGTVKGAN
jgi:preprotein translocase subunit YajC